MKLMKKLSILIALCLCLTVGGVYATWVFTENSDVADQHEHINFGLTDVQYSGSYGEYYLDYSKLNLAIDPVTDGSHEAALKITGQITITFTPAKYAPPEIKENGVPSTYNFATTKPQAEWLHNGVQIFTINTDPVTINWGTPNAEGVFTYVIDAATVADMIKLGDFELGTKLEYDAFKTSLSASYIGISVSDGVTTSTHN